MILHKLTKIGAIVIAVLSIIFLGGLMGSSDEPVNNGWIQPLILLSYVVLFICIAIVLVYVLKNLLSNKETFKRTIISVGLFLAVILISYMMASDAEVKANGELFSGSTTKWVGAGLNAFYLLFLVAVVTMVWSLFAKIKK